MDTYIENISFFEAKYSEPADSYAASLNAYLDRFSRNTAKLKEEILVGKFISSCTGALSSELRLRRPQTLNECVKVANSIGQSSSCMAVYAKAHNNYNNKFKQSSKPTSTKITSSVCYSCGSLSHISSDTKCPAKNASCKQCGKIGHYMKVC